LVSKGDYIVGAVFHVNSTDNTGEFDPFFIERIENCMYLMKEKEFFAQLEQEVLFQHTNMPNEIRVELSKTNPE
jgi:predicted RecB family nuclease